MLTVAHSQWNVKKKRKKEKFKEKKNSSRETGRKGNRFLSTSFYISHCTALIQLKVAPHLTISPLPVFHWPRQLLCLDGKVPDRRSGDPGSNKRINERMKQWDTEERWKRLQLREFGETDVHPSRISNVSFFFLFFQMQPTRKDAFRIRTPSRRGELEKSWGEKSRGMATLIKRHQSRYSMSSRLQCSRRLLKYLTSRTHKTKSYTGAIDEAIIIGCLLVPLLLY